MLPGRLAHAEISNWLKFGFAVLRAENVPRGEIEVVVPVGPLAEDFEVEVELGGGGDDEAAGAGGERGDCGGRTRSGGWEGGGHPEPSVAAPGTPCPCVPSGEGANP